MGGGGRLDNNMAESQKRDADRKRETQELRYAYYIRCERMKDRGGQCKAPALKGTRVCYKHRQQDEANRRREEMIRALELPRLSDARSIQAALGKIAQALIDGRIDERCARYLFHWLQTEMRGKGQNSRLRAGRKN